MRTPPRIQRMGAVMRQQVLARSASRSVASDELLVASVSRSARRDERRESRVERSSDQACSFAANSCFRFSESCQWP